MPYCTQCGTMVGDTDVYCGTCGTRQGDGPARPAASASSSEKKGAGKAASDFLSGITPRNAALLCYIPFVGWVPCLVILATDRFRHDRDVRFHAFQGLYLGVSYLFVDNVLGPVFNNIRGMGFIDNLLKLAVLGAWVFMLIRTSQDVLYRLPFFGELAERSVSEQQ